MKKILIAVLLFLLPVPLMAQEIHFSAGLMNVGQLAREETNHVRLGANGHDVYFALGVDGKIAGGVKMSFKGTYMPTALHAWPCLAAPCEKVSRWQYRPTPTTALVENVSLSTFVVGFNASPVHEWIEATGGVGLMILSAGDYRFWGGMPMAVPMFSGETRLRLPLNRISAGLPNVGIEGGIDFVPASKRSRFIVLDYATGAKQASYKQQNWYPVHLGANVAVGH